MGQAALIIALGLLPAFQPGPEPASRPLMWETPVSWNAPPPPAAPGLAGLLELESILTQAGLHLSAGDLKSAQADYEKILSSANRTAPRALALAGYKNVLRQRIAVGEKFLYRNLIQTLKEEWRLGEALALLPVIGVDLDTPAEVKKFIRSQEPILALRLGRYDQAAALWARPDSRQEAGWLARTEQRRGRFGRAAEIWLGLAPKTGKSPGQDLVDAWTCLVKGGLFSEAAHLVEKYPALKKTTDYSWRMGLAALAAGGLAQAEIYFNEVLAGGKAQKARQPGARYFLARTLAEAGRAPEALTLYTELAEGPFNYYQILARGRLAPQAASPQLTTRLLALLETGPTGRDQDSLGYHLWITEKALSREGMESSARCLLESEPDGPGRGAAFPTELVRLVSQGQWAEVSELLKNNPGDLAALRPLQPALAASLAAWCSQYRQAVSYLAYLPSPDPKGLKKWSHPLIFSRELQAAAGQHGLPPSLLLALIRTESAYQADIMSASNACGLMQLLPATAAQVAAQLGEPEPDDLALFEPAVNIRYGSWYLAALVDGFGSETLALAGYNGGPYNIKSLILARPGLPLDIFLESLIFEETTRYVKRITESRYIYEMAYLGQAVLPDLTGPIQPPRDSLPDF